MTDTVSSPNMAMPIPVVSEAPGPDWATDINACLSVLDGHTHNPGNGVQITPSGILINADFPQNGNNITTVRSLRMTSQGAVLVLASDLGCIYNVLGDLYYNDGSGNNVRITQSGSVTGSAGTITGLPSGTASASYSGGTFTFLAATATPAAMAVGPVAIGNSTAASKTVTLAPDAGIAANYSITFPAALPAALNYATLDNTGALSYNTSGKTGTGAVVLANAPTLTGNVPAFQAVKLNIFPASNTASTSAKVGGTIYCGGGTPANSGTGETILYTYTLPAGSMLSDDTLDILYGVTLVSNGNTKDIKIYFGSVSVSVANAYTAGGFAGGMLTVRRIAANSQYYSVLQSGNSNATVASSSGALSQTDSSPIVIKITGQSSVASNDVTCVMFRINYLPGS